MAPQSTKFNTSFIPKNSVAAPQGKSSGAEGFKKKAPNLFSIIGLAIFLASLLATAGVFLWENQINNQIQDQLADLSLARSEFDEQTIANANRLNERIQAVRNILDNHKAPSNILTILEGVILKSVRLRNFSYNSQDGGSIKIAGSGDAAGYESVVLQSDEFGYTGDFRDVIFSNVQTSDNQTVNFNFSAMIDATKFLYSKNMNRPLSNNPPLNKMDELAENASRVNNIFER